MSASHVASLRLSALFLALGLSSFLPLAAEIKITEIVALSNDDGLADLDGDFTDWIELSNDGADPVDLSGWRLSDDSGDSGKWIFPNGVIIEAASQLLVHASGKNRRLASSELHTNFSLKNSGEYLALFNREGDLVQDFSPTYPPQFEGASFGLAPESGELAYFSPPTPGAPNTSATTTLSPILSDATDSVTRPSGGAGSADLRVEITVTQGSYPVSSVQLITRTMLSPEEAPIELQDDGANGDLAAGDGIYTATITTSHLQPGEMLRWRFVATDSQGSVSESPNHRVPHDSDRYYGTVALNPLHENSQLPIMETFVTDEAAADTDAGTRVSLYYLGKFYDNIQMDVHGQSTREFPKKSYDLDFNRGNRFLWREGEKRAKDINLLTNWADKSKVRNTMAYEFLQRAGAGYHYAFPIRVDRNGEFFTISDLVEDGDDRFLERIGLDPKGALYKMYDRLVSSSNARKQTRKSESSSDLSTLIHGLEPSSRNTLERRRLYAYDNVNIAATVNHLAAIAVGGISDTGHKNYYMYRDTEGTREWNPLPWDVDLSAGRRWRPETLYFEDQLHINQLNWEAANPLWELIHTTPEFRQMYRRRVRTLRNEVLLQNGATPDWYTSRLTELRDKMDPSGVFSDAERDYSKWGSWGNEFTSREGIDRILNDYLPARRDFIVSYSNRNGFPADQPIVPNVTIETIDFNPDTGDQEDEYLVIKNQHSEPVDLSGWTISGGIQHTFPSGTVIPSGEGTLASDYQGLLHLVRNTRAFRARPSGPRRREFRFIQGNYQGQLSARGETVELRTKSGTLVDSQNYPAAPTATQSALRVVEVNYHPTDPSSEELASMPGLASEDFEFLVLRNTGEVSLEIGGASFSEGITYLAPPGTTLAAGENLVVAKNPAALALRYPEFGNIVGPFFGTLSNDGESLRLMDPTGENILNFSYNDRWYPPSDGQGERLVLRSDETAYDTFDAVANWGASSPNGNITTHFNAWQEEQFPKELWEAAGSINADPDGDSIPNWQEYAFGTNPASSDEPIFFSSIIEHDGQSYLAGIVRRRIDGSDLIWSLQEGVTLSDMSNVPSTITQRETHGDGTETVTLRAVSPIGSSQKKFARLRLSQP